MAGGFYRRTAMATAIAACFPGASFAAGVARVDFATGNVAAIAPDGRSRPLAKGAEINVGETVSTQQGRAQLRFADGAYMSLQPQTDFKVEEFKYSGKDEASDGIVMNLLKGGLRTITGLIGRTNRNAYRLKTEVATIGIRGTEYSVRYTNSIEVFVADGAISVENQSGSFVVPGGTGVMVSNQNTPPQQTEQKPVLPPEGPVQQEQEEQTQQPANPVNPIQEAFPAVTQTILTGTITGNWAFSHPSFPQTGAGISETNTLDGSGALVSFTDSFEGGTTTLVGSSSSLSSGNDGVIAWGRWANGMTDGDGIAAGRNTVAPSELHYVVGIAGTIPTSGTATYTMIGATPPSSFESVTLQSSTLKIDFGGGSNSFHATWNVNGGTVQTPPSGGSLTVSGAQIFGGACLVGPFSFTSSVSYTGFLAGEAAARAGLAYRLTGGWGGAHGTIAYTKSGP